MTKKRRGPKRRPTNPGNNKATSPASPVTVKFPRRPPLVYWLCFIPVVVMIILMGLKMKSMEEELAACQNSCKDQPAEVQEEAKVSSAEP